MQDFIVRAAMTHATRQAAEATRAAGDDCVADGVFHLSLRVRSARRNPPWQANLGPGLVTRLTEADVALPPKVLFY